MPMIDTEIANVQDGMSEERRVRPILSAHRIRKDEPLVSSSVSLHFCNPPTSKCESYLPSAFSDQIRAHEALVSGE